MSVQVHWYMNWFIKLDGVGPVDNRPSTDKLHLFVQKKKCDMWHVTCDMWHVTRDIWHMTCDTWHVWGGWTSSQIFSSLALTVCDLWYYEDLEEKDESLNEWINDEAVYRTAPATPGLLIKAGRKNPQAKLKVRWWKVVGWQGGWFYKGMEIAQVTM